MKYTVKQLIERLDTEIEMVCCDSARSDWQTLKTAVLAQQTNNKQSTPCTWKCACGQDVVGDYCRCGAYRCDL